MILLSQEVAALPGGLSLAPSPSSSHSTQYLFCPLASTLRAHTQKSNWVLYFGFCFHLSSPNIDHSEEPEGG